MKVRSLHKTPNQALFLVCLSLSFLLAPQAQHLLSAPKKYISQKIKSISFGHHISFLSFHSSTHGLHKNLLAITSNRYVFLWDHLKQKTNLRLPKPPCLTRGMQFSPKGNYLFALDRKCRNIALKNKEESTTGIEISKRIYLWQYTNKAKQLYKRIYLGNHFGNIVHISMDQEEKKMISVGEDGLVKLWSLDAVKKPIEKKYQKNHLIHTLRIPAYSKQRLSLFPYTANPLLNILALHNWQDYYMIFYRIPWDKDSKPIQLHRTEYPFIKKQRLFCFSPDARFYFDGVRLRTMQNGTFIYSLTYASQGEPQQAIFSPTAEYLAISMHIKKQVKANLKIKNEKNRVSPKFAVDLYNTRQGKHICSFPFAVKIQTMVFSPYSKYLVVADAKNKLHFYLIGNTVCKKAFPKLR